MLLRLKRWIGVTNDPKRLQVLVILSELENGHMDSLDVIGSLLELQNAIQFGDVTAVDSALDELLTEYQIYADTKFQFN